MKITSGLAFALPTLSAAFPSMLGDFTSREAMEDMLRAEIKREAEADPEAQLLNPVGSLLSGVGGVVSGLLNSVGQAVVVQSNKRPEPGYEFKAPGPGDSRGPCPGLNLLANHGYLPRNGYVSFGQILDATARGFNMGTDLATVLATFSVLANGDLNTLSFYLGAGKNGVGGLNRHSTVESDISPNREDYYNGCGDNHHLSSRLVTRMVSYASQDPKKEFSMDVMGKHYAASAASSKANNPYLYYFPFPQIVSVVAYSFYPAFFSNGTYGAGGVANAKSILSIIGAEWDPKAGGFKYVPERWPENWYRRAAPYGAVQALAEGFTNIYPRNIVVPGVPQLGTGNLTPQTILCDLYQGINSIFPLGIAGAEEQTAKALTWALSVLKPVLGGTALGCPNNVLSPNFLYPQSTKQGGPTVPVPVKADAHTGNNVYGKVYFKTEPIKPAC